MYGLLLGFQGSSTDPGTRILGIGEEYELDNLRKRQREEEVVAARHQIPPDDDFFYVNPNDGFLYIIFPLYLR